MKHIFFVRHGEDLSDLYEKLAGWEDFSLSPQGVKKAFELSHKLAKLKKECKLDQFGIILTSPLKRATETAEVLGDELEIRVHEYPYLKERNTYGILSGEKIENRDDDLYKDMYRALKEGQYIPGSERYDDFKERVEVLLKELANRGEESMICVTHGHLITVIIEEFLGKIRKSFGDGSILVCTLDDKGNLEYKDSYNINFAKRETEERRRRKFK